MTPKEFAHATMLVSSLRTRLGHATALAAAVTNERDDLAKQLAAHVESLKLSNAQCGEYLRQNEQLHSELVDVRAALASVSEERDSLKRTLKAWEEAETKPHVRVTADDVADHVVPPVLPLCNVCHECGSELANCSQGTNHHDCPRPLCPRTCTGRHGGGFSPYSGPCKSATPVRHE